MNTQRDHQPGQGDRDRHEDPDPRRTDDLAGADPEERERYGMTGYGGTQGGYGSSFYGREDDRGRRAVQDDREQDERIEKEISRLLRGATYIDAHDVRIHVEHGHVTLGGTVSEERMKFDLQHLVRAVPGVRNITADDLVAKD